MKFSFRDMQNRFRNINLRREDCLFQKVEAGDEYFESPEYENDYQNARRELFDYLYDRYPLFSREQINVIYCYMFQKYDLDNFINEMEEFCDDFLDAFHENTEDY